MPAKLKTVKVSYASKAKKDTIEGLRELGFRFPLLSKTTTGDNKGANIRWKERDSSGDITEETIDRTWEEIQDHLAKSSDNYIGMVVPEGNVLADIDDIKDKRSPLEIIESNLEDHIGKCRWWHTSTNKKAHLLMPVDSDKMHKTWGKTKETGTYVRTLRVDNENYSGDFLCKHYVKVHDLSMLNGLLDYMEKRGEVEVPLNVVARFAPTKKTERATFLELNIPELKKVPLMEFTEPYPLGSVGRTDWVYTQACKYGVRPNETFKQKVLDTVLGDTEYVSKYGKEKALREWNNGVEWGQRHAFTESEDFSEYVADLTPRAAQNVADSIHNEEKFARNSIGLNKIARKLEVRFRYNKSFAREEWGIGKEDWIEVSNASTELRTLKSKIASLLDWKIPQNDWRDCISELCKNNEYDPVKELRKSIRKWNKKDGDPAAFIWQHANKIFKIKNNELNRAGHVLRILHFVSRLHKPGCPIRQTTLLIGKGGEGKTKATKSILPEKYSEHYAHYSFDKEQRTAALEQIGQLVVCMDELEGVMNRQASSIKTFMDDDRFQVRKMHADAITKGKRTFALYATANFENAKMPNDYALMDRVVPLMVEQKHRWSSQLPKEVANDKQVSEYVRGLVETERATIRRLRTKAKNEKNEEKKAKMKERIDRKKVCLRDKGVRIAAGCYIEYHMNKDRNKLLSAGKELMKRGESCNLSLSLSKQQHKATEKYVQYSDTDMDNRVASLERWDGWTEIATIGKELGLLNDKGAFPTSQIQGRLKQALKGSNRFFVDGRPKLPERGNRKGPRFIACNRDVNGDRINPKKVESRLQISVPSTWPKSGSNDDKKGKKGKKGKVKPF